MDINDKNIEVQLKIELAEMQGINKAQYFVRVVTDKKLIYYNEFKKDNHEANFKLAIEEYNRLLNIYGYGK